MALRTVCEPQPRFSAIRGALAVVARQEYLTPAAEDEDIGGTKKARLQRIALLLGKDTNEDRGFHGRHYGLLHIT